jgi:hypothetical protein
MLALVAACGWLLAEDAKKPEDKDQPSKVKGSLPPHFGKLGLSSEQKQQVLKLKKMYTDQIDALKQQIQDLQDKEKAEIDKVLTDEQKAHLKQLKLGETRPKFVEPTDKKPTDTKPPEPDKKPTGTKPPDKDPKKDDK